MSTEAPGTIQDLRKQLFEALARLDAKAGPEEIARAKATAELAQTIINSAKVEVDFLKVTGGKVGSGFIPLKPAELTTGSTVVAERPGVRVTQHRLAG